MNIQYVYLIQTEKFVKSGEPVYKIGKTKQLNYTRFRQYDTGSIQLYQSVCKNCDDMERKIMKLFDTKYERHRGKEYFKGNYDDMLDDISELVENERLINGLVTDIVGDIIENIVDDDDDVVDEGVVEKTAVEEAVVEEEIVVENNRNVSVENNVLLKMKGNYICHCCPFSTKTQYCLDVHLATNKHIRNASPTVTRNKNMHWCKTCNNQYMYSSGLYAHIKKCTGVKKNNDSNDKNNNDSNDKNNNDIIINELKKMNERLDDALLKNDSYALELKKINEKIETIVPKI